MLKRITALLTVLVLLPILAVAGQVSGSIQTPTGGTVNNGTLTFTLSQSGIVSGTASIVPVAVSCYTSNVGSIVGLPDVLALPTLSTNTASGTLTAGTYYVKITYWNASGETAASPERSVILSSAGTVIVTAPVLQPSNASGYKVYISSSSGTETLQGTVTGWTNYSQASALAAGAAAPSSNTSTCTPRFSDEIIPSGTYYTVNLLNKNGSQIAGFPQTWCLYGGSAGVVNVSNGAPNGNCGTNGVFYPTPILATPIGGAGTPQSINGPLDLGSNQLNVGNIVSNGVLSVLAGTFTGTFVSSTANPALTGTVRLAKTDSITFRNQTNTGDVLAVSKATNDSVQIGSPSDLVTFPGGTIYLTGTTGNLFLQQAVNQPITFNTTGVSSGTGGGITFNVNNLSGNTGTSNGGDFTVNAGNGGTTAGNGGNIVLNPGPVTSGTPGSIKMNGPVLNYGMPRYVYVTADFTLAGNTNLQTITGLTWTMPANTALVVPFSCSLMYTQATAAVADQFGIQAATVAPTNISAKAQAYTSASAVTAGNLPTLNTTTATAIVTFTPSATATVFNADISGLIENPSSVSSNVINIMAQQSNAADLLTIKRGSFCRIF